MVPLRNRQSRQLRQPGAQSLPQLGIPVGRDNKDLKVGDLSCKKLKKEERWLVGRVKILQYQDQRSAPRRGPEERRRSLEQPKARALGVESGRNRQTSLNASWSSGSIWAKCGAFVPTSD